MVKKYTFTLVRRTTETTLISVYGASPNEADERMGLLLDGEGPTEGPEPFDQDSWDAFEEEITEVDHVEIDAFKHSCNECGTVTRSEMLDYDFDTDTFMCNACLEAGMGAADPLVVYLADECGSLCMDDDDDVTKMAELLRKGGFLK